MLYKVCCNTNLHPKDRKKKAISADEWVNGAYEKVKATYEHYQQDVSNDNQFVFEQAKEYLQEVYNKVAEEDLQYRL